MVLVERVGEAFELGEQLTVVGSKLTPGDKAPGFTLDYLNPSDSTINQVSLADSRGEVRLLAVINSIDTPVCQVETHRWEHLRNNLPENVQVLTISMDLPFALGRWQSAEDIHHLALSSHRSEQFGQDYGVLLKEWRLLQRAVFVIDDSDHIVHAEYVADQMLEPDYEAAVAKAREAAARTA